MKVSICLPTYNKQGSKHNESYNNLTMLLDLFESLKIQTFKDYELIISDHSTDDSVKLICDQWEKELNIKYYRFEEKYGSCEANLNNAMRKASGKYIKPILQDDFFHDSVALERMVAAIEENDSGWLAAGSVCINENEKSSFYGFHVPTLVSSEAMLKGENLIGSPSVIMHKNEEIFYDECLIWLMDVEFYCRLIDKFGTPCLMRETFFVSRIRRDGISNTMITQGIIEDEKQYCIDKRASSLKRIEEYPAIYERVTKNKII